MFVGLFGSSGSMAAEPELSKQGVAVYHAVYHAAYATPKERVSLLRGLHTLRWALILLSIVAAATFCYLAVVAFHVSEGAIKVFEDSPPHSLRFADSADTAYRTLQC